MSISDTEKKEILDALGCMVSMYDRMMEKIDHSKCWYDAECIEAMNKAPLEARRILLKHQKEH